MALLLLARVGGTVAAAGLTVTALLAVGLARSVMMQRQTLAAAAAVVMMPGQKLVALGVPATVSLCGWRDDYIVK